MDKPENVSEKNLFALKGGGGGEASKCFDNIGEKPFNFIF